MYENPQSALFTKFATGLRELEKQSKSEKPLKVTKFFTHHKMPTTTLKFLKEAGVADYVLADTNNKQGGTFVIFEKPLTNADIQKVIEAYQAYNKQKGDKAKSRKGSGPTITSAVKSRKKFDLDNINFLVEYLNDKVKKNEAAPGYLRPDEASQFPKIVQALTVISTLKEDLPKVTDLLTKLHNQIK